MIASLRGIVTAIGEDYAIIEVGGVGFHVSMPTRTLADVGAPGEELFVHTHLYVKDDALALYGFASGAELRLFTLLIGVSGVGPRHAMRLLSVLTPEALAAAVVHEDVAAMMRAPGVGRKTAARISLELKGTLEKEWAGIPDAGGGPIDGDALEALVALGYSMAEARKGLSSVQDAERLPLEEKISRALQRMGQG
ncbi:MAG: Holliday junction branch migration protein RuvA [Chloroflexi bacterium]|nr:Holliday junction branch migration protein RuvA [Chloroflexota bacterium]